MQSSKPKIAFVEMIDEWQREYLTKQLKGKCEMQFFKETAQQICGCLKDVNALSVFVKSEIDDNFMDECLNLEFIATRSTGFDHIDVKAAAARRIAVSNVPIYGDNTVAEHTFALILSLARNLKKSYLRTFAGNFSSEGLMGFDLNGKTIGVIGAGHIGLKVIRIAQGFGMKAIAFDLNSQQTMAKDLNFQYVTFEELLCQSDIVTLHLPLLPATRHLMDAKSFQLVKKGAVLINTARGGLVDTNALVQALDSGILAGAGLDVLENEGYLTEEKRLLHESENQVHWQKLKTNLENHMLLSRDNVVYTPHIAFYSREAAQRILDTTVQNIEAFLQKRSINKV